MVPKGLYGTFYANTSHGFLLGLWLANTHRHTKRERYAAHTGANRLTHPYKYILTPPAVFTTFIYITLNE